MKIVTGRESELCGSFVAIIKSMSYFVTGFIWTFSTLLAAYLATGSEQLQFQYTVPSPSPKA